MSQEQNNNRKAVYTIVDGTGDKKRWIRIGIAFVNRDQSLNIVLDALPVNGQLHVRDFPPRDSEVGGDEAQPPAEATTGGRKPRSLAA